MNLHTKCITWLRANPGRQLNADMIADFFQVNRAKVATELSKAVLSGDLNMLPEGGEDGEPVWLLPTDVSAFKTQIKPTKLSGLLMVSASVAAEATRRYTPRDFDSVKIEDDVPMDVVAPRGEAQYQKIINIFQRMKPTQSVVLPDCNALRHALAIFNKVEGQQVSRRTLDKDSVRVWRIS